MATKSTATTAPETTAATAPAVLTVRILRDGVHAGGFIFGKGATVRLAAADANGLVSTGAAKSLN